MQNLDWIKTMLILQYIVLGTVLCHIANPSKPAIDHEFDNVRSLNTAIENLYTSTPKDLYEETCKTKSRKHDLKYIARSNLFFTTAMFRSMTLKDDTFYMIGTFD